jgi:transmembrane sensor
MTGPNVRVETAEEEAAAWHARLGTTVVATQTIEDFFAWRAIAGNAEAYRRVEKVWKDSAGLGGDPAVAKALDDALRRGDRRLARRAPLPKVAGAVAAGLVLVVATAGAFWWQDRGVYETSVGEQRVVQLADGSSIRLDTGSAVRVRFERGERRVSLEEGQAMFTVAPDASRPFVVSAGDTRVVAIGTVFDVRRQGDGVSVTLVSGAVDVSAARSEGSTRRMAAGQQTRVSAGELVTRAVNTEAETSWTSGRLVFEGVPLRQAVGEVNRYLTDKVILDRSAPGDVRVEGVFDTGDRDAFVGAASAVFNLTVAEQADGSVRLSQVEK